MRKRRMHMICLFIVGDGDDDVFLRFSCRSKQLEEESAAAQAEQSNALLDAVHSDALIFD